jgi:hypothetical protein
MMGAIYHKNHGGGNNMEPNIGLEWDCIFLFFSKLHFSVMLVSAYS